MSFDGSYGDDEHPSDVPTLCEDCSKHMLSEENWLACLVLASFVCIICGRLCCTHLRRSEHSSICEDHK